MFSNCQPIDDNNNNNNNSGQEASTSNHRSTPAPSLIDCLPLAAQSSTPHFSSSTNSTDIESNHLGTIDTQFQQQQQQQNDDEIVEEDDEEEEEEEESNKNYNSVLIKENHHHHPLLEQAECCNGDDRDSTDNSPNDNSNNHNDNSNSHHHHHRNAFYSPLLPQASAASAESVSFAKQPPILSVVLDRSSSGRSSPPPRGEPSAAASEVIGVAVKSSPYNIKNLVFNEADNEVSTAIGGEEEDKSSASSSTFATVSQSINSAFIAPAPPPPPPSLSCNLSPAGSSPVDAATSCSYALGGQGHLSVLGASTTNLLMPAPITPLTPSPTASSSSSSLTRSSATPNESLVNGSSASVVSSATGYNCPATSTTSIATSSSTGCYNPSLFYAGTTAATANNSEFDQYLNAFFTQNSSAASSSSTSGYPTASATISNSVSSFLEPTSGGSSGGGVGLSNNQAALKGNTSHCASFVSPPPTSSFLGQLNTSSLFSPPNSSCSTLSPSNFLHPRTSGTKFSPFTATGAATSSFESLSAEHTSHHPYTSSTASQYPYIDHSFASPSGLYYPLRSTAGNNKRPFTLNSFYGSGGAGATSATNLGSNQSKRFSTSISESSGEDSGFVSTGSPATDTFSSSPHSSPPQLIPPPPLSTITATKSSPSTSSLSLNRNNNNNNNSNKTFSSNTNNNTTSMSASPTLPGQYGHISDAVTGATYSFDDYSTLPFPTGWNPIITNLDSAASAAAAVAAAVSQAPTLHHHSNLSQLQAAAVLPPTQQQSTPQSNTLQLTSVSGLGGGVGGGGHLGSSAAHTSITSNPGGGGAMSLKDIKLYNNYPNKSAITNAELRIIKQPETHHRARYMTEGSRGTIKDRTGRGYPVIQLLGYNKSTVKLQCFIGHDQKIGDPHLFYQACEVSGKTPYTFVKVDGINTIELDLLPKNNMQAVFDCMGILKERNVDVERKVLRNRRKSSSAHRPGVNATEEAKMIRNTNKSRSTHCRMVFRCILPDTGEILQTVSDPILCTQPLGSPEIYKMSLRECDLKGGLELFVIGKNFHKDSKVIFECQATHWRKVIVPQKEFLNSTHLVCGVPPYDGLNAQCLPLVNVDVSVHCNHKNSDPMKFIYTNGFSSGGVNVSNGFDTLGSMNSQAAVAAAAAYASVVANPIGTGSNANALFLLERNDVLK